MYSLTVENSKGERLELTNDNRYDLIKIDGLNPPKATLNFSQLANYDGSIFNSGQLENRNIVLYVVPQNDIETNRINLYKYFPLKKVVRIYYENDNRKVYIDGKIESFEFDPFAEKQQIQISIICPNPYWKADEITELSFSSTVDLFEFPFAIEQAGIEFSRFESITTAYIENGDVETGFIVEFVANANQVLQPKIINRTTQKYFEIEADMQEGDLIRINSYRGEKSVKLIRDGVETNILNDRTPGSNWLTLVSGINELSYECLSGQENLTVYVYVTRYYEGV